MRLNQYLALHTHLSRRGADKEIEKGSVHLNGRLAKLGDTVNPGDKVSLNGSVVSEDTELQTILFHKPAGYVCSRDGQGSDTIYDILPTEFQHLNPVGRLDKDSSGLLILTNDGALSEKLSHPRYSKVKKYEVKLDKPLKPLHQQMISDFGVNLEDGLSKLILEKLDETGKTFRVTMTEGRNRQIRRTFSALGYRVTRLHRTNFGPYSLGDLKPGSTTTSALIN